MRSGQSQAPTGRPRHFGGKGALAEKPVRLPQLVLVEVVDDEDAVEVVEFVLEQPCLELVSLDRDLVALEVDADEVDLLGTHDLEGEFGHREAALVEGPLSVGLRDLGIQDHPVGLPVVVDEEPLLHAHLWGGQADARRLVHRLEHLLAQADERSIDVSHVVGPRPQNGVADHSDLTGCHASKATVGVVEDSNGDALAQPDGDATDHYWSGSPDLGSRPRQLDLLLPDLDLHLTADRGVFSADRIDRGTRYLLQEGPPSHVGAAELLDLGCGYGPIALALAVRNPDARVWAVDVNPRARELCQANATAAGLDNVLVAAPDDVPDDTRFDACWSNPPIRIGKAALHDLLERWLDRLAPGGSAHLVVQRHLGADSLARWLDDQGWTTIRRASRKGYRLLDVAARHGDEEAPR